MVKVKTTFYRYGEAVESIAEYTTKKAAQKVIDVTLKWGIDIISSIIIKEE